jgi:hypothetical protein
MQISPYPKQSGHLILKAPLTTDGNYNKMGLMPGFKKWEGRSLIVRVTGANIGYIVDTWPDAEWEGEAAKHRDTHLERLGGQALLLEAKESEEMLEDESGYVYKRSPMDHQRRAFQVSRDAPAYAYLMEQGTGKTKVVIDNASYLYWLGKIDALLIIAWPNGVHRMWVDDELKKDCSVPYSAEFWSSNLTNEKVKSIDRVLQAKRLGKLVVMTFNVEGFVSDKAKDCIMSFLDRHRCMVVIDQSASISNPSAKRTKFLIDDVSEHKNALYKRIMDGDPVAEGADELYSQFKFLDPDIIGHDTWTGFKNEFCIIGTKWDKYAIAGYRNIDKLHALIDPYCFRVLAKDCLDLPERVYRRWTFDLSKGERRIFDELKTKNLTFFEPRPEDEEALEELPEDGVIEERLAITKNMRLQQISSGWWPDKNDFKAINGDASPSRLDALLALLKAVEGKALIFARFRADLELIQATLGKLAVSYHGGIKEQERADNKVAFMEDESVRYFIGQPRNAGIGHTLTKANHVIFYSNDHSLRLRAESEKRAHRKGLQGSLTIWDLCANQTQDTKLVNCLRHKRSIASEILNDPESFFLIYENEI